MQCSVEPTAAHADLALGEAESHANLHNRRRWGAANLAAHLLAARVISDSGDSGLGGEMCIWLWKPPATLVDRRFLLVP
jgi:hypothetical protein